MGHKHRRIKTPNRGDDTLSDIVAMSNDDEIRDSKKKSNNELDDYGDDDYTSDEDDYTSDDEDDDYTSDKKSKKKNKYENYDEDEFNAPTIRSKKPKAVRGGEFAQQEISEVKKNKGVEDLSNQFNNNLHQIQIALPYGHGADRQQIQSPVGNYALYERPKKKKIWYETKWFRLTMKIITAIIVLALLGWFAWSYISMRDELYGKKYDALSDEENDDEKKLLASVNALKEDDEKVSKVVVVDTKGNVIKEISSDDEDSEDNGYDGFSDYDEYMKQHLDDKEWDKIGEGKEMMISGGSKCNKNDVWKTLKRDEHGRFVKRNE